jgi:hypothetical protein
MDESLLLSRRVSVLERISVRRLNRVRDRR